MRTVELDLAVRREDEHAIVAQVAQHVVQQRQGPVVRPMDVVDEHQQAAIRGQRLQEAADVVEQPQPLFAGRQRRVGGERAELRFDFGRELGHFRRGRPEPGAQLLDTLPVRPLAQRLDERQIGRGRFVLVATAAQKRRPALPRMRDQFLREPRLAHARLAGQQNQMPACLQRLVPVLLQLRELGGASDEFAAHELVQRRAGCEPHVFDAQRRELRRQVGSDELEQRFRFDESAQLVRAEIAQRRPRRQCGPNELRGRRRQQRLAAVPGVHHALCAGERQR